MVILSIILPVLSLTGALYCILSTLALVFHFRANPQFTIHNSQFTISLLKPVAGIDSEARVNFLSFLNQSQNDYQVLFGVLDPDDPAISLISEITRDFDNASLYIGSRIDGSNNKVRILDKLASRTDADILIVTDADTRVTPDFIDRIVKPFEDQSVGAVTCMYRGIKAKSIADDLEGLHMTCVFAPGVAAAKYNQWDKIRAWSSYRHTSNGSG